MIGNTKRSLKLRFFSFSLCRSKNFIHLCNTNSFNISIYAKIIFNDKKAAYGCKSRDFSTYVETVGSDRLSFFYPNTF